MPLLRTILAVALVAGCSARAKPRLQPAPGRRTISEGYSLLYYAVSEQSWADKILLVKFESEEVKRLITRIAKYAKDLKGKLEELAKQYPAIHLDPPPPTETEQRARSAQYHERLKEMLVQSGRDFERTMLLTQYCTLDELRHLAGVMVDMETDTHRRAFWKEVQTELDEEYRQVAALLVRSALPEHRKSGAPGPNPRSQ